MSTSAASGASSGEVILNQPDRSRVLEDAHQQLLAALIHVNDILTRNDIPYWIDGGTLLGAVRSGRFIPWDDDIDICVFREDLERACSQLAADLPPGMAVIGRVAGRLATSAKVLLTTTAGVGEYGVQHAFETNRTELQLDIYAIDYVADRRWLRSLQTSAGFVVGTYPWAKQRARSRSEMSRLRRARWRMQAAVPLTVIEAVRERLTSPREQRTQFVCYALDGPFARTSFRVRDILPLGEIEFEGTRFPAPRNAYAYLRAYYGDDYLLPRPDWPTI